MGDIYLIKADLQEEGSLDVRCFAQRDEWQDFGLGHQFVGRGSADRVGYRGVEDLPVPARLGTAVANRLEIENW